MKTKIKTGLIVFGLLNGIILHAQEEKESSGITAEKHRYLGLGFETSIFRSSDFQLSDFMPIGRLNLSVNPIKYLRVDFQYGMNNYSRDQVVTDWSGSVINTFRLKDSYKEMAFGLFGVYPFKDGFISYLGFRYSLGRYENQSLNNDGNGYYIDSEKSLLKNASIVLGMEYRFGNRFSVGGEFRFNNVAFEPLDPSSTNILNDRLAVTETALMFRFYPF